HGHDPAAVAMDDRDRAAPVALAREEPVAEAVARRCAPEAALFEPLDDLPLALRRRQAAELAGVDEHLNLGVRDVCRPLLDLAGGRSDDLHDRKTEVLREVEVALVVRG